LQQTGPVKVQLLTWAGVAAAYAVTVISIKVYFFKVLNI